MIFRKNKPQKQAASEDEKLLEEQRAAALASQQKLNTALDSLLSETLGRKLRDG